MYGGLTVEGGRELRRSLRAAGSDLTELKAANKRAADIVAAAAPARTPRVSGRLASSIRGAGTKTAGIVRAGNNRKSGTGVPYALPIHWGWPKRNIKANPFLSDTAQQTEERWMKEYEIDIDRIINAVKGKS